MNWRELTMNSDLTKRKGGKNPLRFANHHKINVIVIMPICLASLHKNRNYRQKVVRLESLGNRGLCISLIPLYDRFVKDLMYRSAKCKYLA